MYSDTSPFSIPCCNCYDSVILSQSKFFITSQKNFNFEEI